MGVERVRDIGDVIGLALLAGFFALWRLGTSGLFVDEVFALQCASVPLGDVVDQVRHLETSPPAYFWLLHEWIGRAGADSEWAVRLPSALAAVGLVIAVWRLGTLVAGRAVGRVAGVLAALSPLVIMYGQLARPYAVLMLLVCVAVICALEAERRGSIAWLAACAVATIAALWVHYTAWFVVPALIAALASAPRSRASQVAAFAVVVIGAGLAWEPLARDQFDRFPNGGLSGIAHLTWENAVRVIGAPFDGRASTPVSVNLVRLCGLAAIVAGIALFATRSRIPRPTRALITTLAVLPTVIVFVLVIAGKDVLINRYVTVGVPFQLVALAAGLATAPRRLAWPVGLLAAVAAIGGLMVAERRSADWADLRGAAAYIAPRWEPGDVVIGSNSPAIHVPLAHYAGLRLPAGAPVHAGFSEIPAGQRSAARLWLVAESRASRSDTERYLATVMPGYRLRAFKHLPSGAPLNVLLLNRR